MGTGTVKNSERERSDLNQTGTVNVTDTVFGTETVMTWKGYGQELERKRYEKGKGNGQNRNGQEHECLRTGTVRELKR